MGVSLGLYLFPLIRPPQSFRERVSWSLTKTSARSKTPAFPDSWPNLCPFPPLRVGLVYSGYTASLRGAITSFSRFLFLRLKNVTHYNPNNNRSSFLSNNLTRPVFLLICSGMNGSRTNTNWARGSWFSTQSCNWRGTLEMGDGQSIRCPSQPGKL